uniref:Putative trypsin-like salivary secreted protein n=1 Tax=Corethrella appendiculata TaxID=1370023 RepID=U5ERF5_9DIPT
MKFQFIIFSWIIFKVFCADEKLKFPPVVSIRKSVNNEWVCCGVLVDVKIVLTTANCLIESTNPENYFIAFGRYNLPNGESFAPNKTDENILNYLIANKISEIIPEPENVLSNAIDTQLSDIDEPKPQTEDDRKKMQRNYLHSLFENFAYIRENRIKNSEYREIESIFVHKNSIVLIRLKQSVPENIDIPIININSDIPLQRLFTVFGWGSYNRNGSLISKSNQLQSFELVSIDPSVCIEEYSTEFNSDQHLCMVSRNDDTPCYGFSGAPLLQNGKLFGLIVFGDVDCNATKPIVFVKISEKIELIVKSLRDMDSIINDNFYRSDGDNDQSSGEAENDFDLDMFQVYNNSNIEDNFDYKIIGETSRSPNGTHNESVSTIKLTSTSTSKYPESNDITDRSGFLERFYNYMKTSIG